MVDGQLGDKHNLAASLRLSRNVYHLHNTSSKRSVRFSKSNIQKEEKNGFIKEEAFSTQFFTRCYHGWRRCSFGSLRAASSGNKHSII
jgi:hypothetical protein